MKPTLTIALLIFSTLFASSQVSVKIEVDPSRKHGQFLIYEPVTAIVTITNRSGRELTYTSSNTRGVSRSWLDFSVRNSKGQGLQKRMKTAFRKAVIPAGRSVARSVNLGYLFSIGKVGNFAVTAHVTQPGSGGEVYTSNSGHFTVGSGNVIYKTPYGVPDSPAPKREYKVVTFNDGERTSIYAQVMNTRSGTSISTFRLSNYLAFHKPQVTLDGKNQLHVLYLASPRVFVHATVNQDGAHTGTEYYKRVNARKPQFVAFANGDVKVKGGVRFDPKKAAERASKARKASERPQ